HYHTMHAYFTFSDPPTPQTYTLSLHDALPIWKRERSRRAPCARTSFRRTGTRSRSTSIAYTSGRNIPRTLTRRTSSSTRRPRPRSEEHTSELQSRENLVCRLLLEKKKHQAHPE